MPWKDSIPLNSPTNLTALEAEPGIYHLQWAPPSTAVGGDDAKQFAVYRLLGRGAHIEDPSNLLTILPGSQSTYRDVIERPTSPQYRYVVTAIDKANVESAPSNEAAVMIAEFVALSTPFQPVLLLAQNTPNPFSKFCFISYELKERAKVELKILDAKGKEVAVPVNTIQDAGRYVIALDGGNFSPGRYTYRLLANGFSATKSMEVSR